MLAPVLALALATVAATQASLPPSKEPGLVIIDAIATDAGGRAVGTLKPGDFTLREDGAVQPIEEVRFVNANGTARLFAIYLDDYYISAANTQLVRDALHRFVDQ